jgi:hypothetical protein
MTTGEPMALAEDVDSEQPIPGRCGAHHSSGIGYCAAYPMPNGRCYKHGGNTPRGALSANFKHGRYSPYLPADLAGRFEAARNDPQLLSYHDDVALISTRIDELLERVRSGESGFAWKQLNRLWKEFERHRLAGNVDKMQATLDAIGEPMRRGLADHAAWIELSEQMRLEQIASTITVEEAYGFLGTVVDVLKRHVADRAILDAIGAELSQLVTLDAVPLAARSRRRRSR